MRISTHITLSIIVSLTLGSVASEEEVDPFAETHPKSNAFETTGAFKVTLLAGLNPESIPSVDWPKIENPTSFNPLFDRPFRIWRVDGGYFGAFDSSEWGGALFFATEAAPTWTRIIDTHIQDLERFEDDTFLATGGLAQGGLPQISLSRGAAYLITRLPTKEWQARMVFKSEIGIPRVVGTSATHAFLKADTKKLIVLGLKYPMGREPFFGVDATGAIHYLGECAKNKPSEQGGGGNAPELPTHPSTAPSKSRATP